LVDNQELYCGERTCIQSLHKPPLHPIDFGVLAIALSSLTWLRERRKSWGALFLKPHRNLLVANDWEAIAEYGQTKQDWLKTWLELPNGIPSPDTYREHNNDVQGIEVLKQISPVAWQHINLYGRYEFRKCAQPIDLEDIVRQLTQSPSH
jgi:hypothetical protein